VKRHATVFTTERGAFHQQMAMDAAPQELDVTMLRQPSREELFGRLANAEFLISERTGLIDADVIAAAPNLRMILRLGALAHDIDLAAARSRGLVVAIQAQRGVIMVAEHVVMQMLALGKRLREVTHLTVDDLALAAGDWAEPRRTDEDTFAYNWTGRHDIEGLWGKTVGVLGFGEIGAELARRLRGWECRVLYNRRRRLPAMVEVELGLEYASQEEMFRQSDFLVNLLPYFPATDLSIGAERIALLRAGACVTSCGSGSVLDEAALAEACKAGRLGGVALDTFEWEPIKPENPLRLIAASDPQANVLLTPHTAAGAPPVGAWLPRREEYEPVLRFLRGEPVARRLT
jgi:phosphoglycerate dehydrogenase-like enzyme